MLAEDTTKSIKAVMVVHNETTTGVTRCAATEAPHLSAYYWLHLIILCANLFCVCRPRLARDKDAWDWLRQGMLFA